MFQYVVKTNNMYDKKSSGGLSERHLSSLTKKQVEVIEPDVITHMPPEKVKVRKQRSV